MSFFVTIFSKTLTDMKYSRINFFDFGPYNMERVARRGVKKFSWPNVVTENEIENFSAHLYDERTKVIIQSTLCMPFTVYVIPATEAYKWVDYVMENEQLSQIYNCVYLLYGHDFIYAGKSVNGDRILGHVNDEAKSGFEYQMLFVPNNENPSTRTNWTSDFMAYLESLMIERIKDSQYCKNEISGKSKEKNQRDLNLNEDKESFAENVVDLIFDVFADITYANYLLPENLSNRYTCEEADNTPQSTEDNKMITFWDDVIQLVKRTKPDNEFAKLQPRKYQWNGVNMNSIISCASIGCNVTKSSCRVELVGWGNKNSSQTNLDVFDHLHAHKDEIEKEMECSLNWDRNEEKFTTRISISKSLRYQNADNGTLRDIADFFSEYFHKFMTIMPKYADGLEPEEIEAYDEDPNF